MKSKIEYMLCYFSRQTVPIGNITIFIDPVDSNPRFWAKTPNNMFYNIYMVVQR